MEIHLNVCFVICNFDRWISGVNYTENKRFSVSENKKNKKIEFYFKLFSIFPMVCEFKFVSSFSWALSQGNSSSSISIKSFIDFRNWILTMLRSWIRHSVRGITLINTLHYKIRWKLKIKPTIHFSGNLRVLRCCRNRNLLASNMK